MFEKYTDLAMESHELSLEKGTDDGLTACEYTHGDVAVTCVTVPEGSRRAAGRYCTLDIGKVWQMPSEMRRTRAEAIAEVIDSLCPEGDGCVLVAGIGNRDITPDSVGPLTSDKVIATRHLKKLGNALYNEIGFSEVSTVAPGVMGQTGIESGEIIACVAARIKPRAVIAVDALASRRLSRLCTTVQISDAGISPGSGVDNNRGELSLGTVGVPVIAVGLPTVVDAATLASDLLDEVLMRIGCDDADCSDLAARLSSGSGGGMFVSLKESDVIIRETSRLIADGINLAFHKNIPYDDINEYRDR